jgi:uncharacterized oxidoreductase
MKITGNTIFIPGSTSGIGLALALRLQAKGNTVIVGGRRTELLEQIAAQHPGIHTVRIDTADAASVRSAADEVLAPIRLVAAFVEHLQKQPAATIITVSSGLGFAPLRVTPSYNASKAAIHMLSESLRLQFADSTVEVKELVPPAVKTDLVPGQRDNDAAMPLNDFLDQVMQLLENEPDSKEIQVERVKFLRYGEARGDYDQVIAALNASDPHGK